MSEPPTADERAAYNAALAAQNAAEDMAVQVLWSLSGRQFGICETTVRPCPEGHRQTSLYPYGLGFGFGGYSVFGWDGFGWFGMGCGCAGRCRRSGPGAVHLPGPAAEITKVQVAADTLTADQYKLENNVLYRVGDSTRWPTQRLDRPTGEPHTWAVTYLRGTPPPAGSASLVGLLAKEFLAACAGDKCRLPRNVTSVSRNGVSYQVYNPHDIFAYGKTGLPEVDLWLAAVNPAHITAAPSVI